MRLEDPILTTGQARFIADLSESDVGLDSGVNFAHVAFVRSPVAHAHIVAVDCEVARAAEGVIAVLAVDDLNVVADQPWAPAVPNVFTQPLLADNRVRFTGEPIAIVVADTMAAAVDATELVDVEFDLLSPVIDLDWALSDEVTLFGDGPEPTVNPTNVVAHIDRREFGVGEQPPGAGFFDGCEVLVSQQMLVPRQSAAPIEPRGLIAWWTTASNNHDGGADADADGPDLHLWAGTQRPHGYRDQLVALLGMPADRIHVTCPHVGGGFGGKPSRGAEEHVIPVVARMLGRALRWVESRSDNLIASTHGRAERFDLQLGGTGDGRLIAVDVNMVKDAGAYPTSCAFLPAAYTQDNTPGCYTFDRVAFSSVSVATNTAPISAFRGAGRAPYVVMLEAAVDAYAHRVNMDPLEVRRRNLIPASAMPWRTAVGSTYDEADYLADLEAAADAVGYEQWRQRQAQTRPGDPLIGIGIASYNHKTGSAGGEEAVVSVTADGGAKVVTGSTDQGHGHRTTWTQIVSTTMGIPPEQIEVVEGSTDEIGSGQGAVGSRSIQTAGAAIHNACDDLIERARSLAANHLEAAVADVVFALSDNSGRFHVVGTPSRSVGWAQVAAEATAAHVDLSCGDLHEPEHVSYPSGCHIAVVEIDAETGQPRVVRYVAADDVGTRLNPTIVDGQLHGGIAAGVSHALGEVMSYDQSGNPLTGSFASYSLATADELPSFDLVGTDGQSSFHRQGYKGVGESGTIGATPAVLNAVNDALRFANAEPIGLPCTAEAIWLSLTAAT